MRILAAAVSSNTNGSWNTKRPGAHRIRTQAPDIDAVVEDSARGRLDKAGDEVGQGALARPRGTDQGDHFADASFEIHVPHRLGAVGIAERRVFDAEVFDRPFDGAVAVAIRIHRGVGDVEHPSHSRHVVLQVEPHRTQPAQAGDHCRK